MRAVVQRVKSSSVSVDGTVVGKIGKGLNVLLGVEQADTDKDIAYLAEKIVNLRIFDDADGVMNLSLKDVAAEMLVVSQFTLLADARKGRRPSYAHAARPDKARQYYQRFIEVVKSNGITVASGTFQAEMLVQINNDGPVTILLDSQKKF